MSLFDKISGAGASGNVIGRAEGAIRTGASKAGEWAGGVGGGGKIATAIGNAGAALGGQAASRAMNKHLPPEVRGAVNSAGEALGQIATGDIEGGILTALEAALGGKPLGALLGSQASQGNYWGGVNMLYGGITPSEARRIYQEAVDTGRSKKNLFLLKVESNLVGDCSHEFNLFCTDIERGYGEISGSKARSGGLLVDTVQQREPITVRITTMDDQAGLLKRWFLDHVAAIARPNGTFGVPGSYAVKITLQHSFVGEGYGLISRGLFRAQSCEASLSRREDAMEELQMTFTQLDSFMGP